MFTQYKSNLKIAINTRVLIKNKMEGYGRFTYEICKSLVEQHPEHKFYFIFDRPYDEEYIFQKNITPIIVYPPARHPILWYLWFEWAIPKVLKKINPDIFVSLDGYLSLRSPVKTLMAFHDISFVHYPKIIPRLIGAYLRYYMPKFLNRADRLITLSNHSKKDICDHYNISPKKVDITHASSHGDFKAISRSEKETIKNKYSNGEDYFLYVGSIHPRKNIPRLLKAFEQFKKRTDSKMKLLLAGEFMFNSALEKSIHDRLKFKNDIKFLGYLNDELFELTAAAYASTYISLYEGFGMPLVESMNCHIPFITSNVSSMPEIAGDCGLIVSPTDVEEICTAMCKLYYDKELYKSLVEKCKLRKSTYNWDKAAKLLYASILKTLK